MTDIADILSLACPFCSTKEHAVIPMATKAKQLHAIRRTEPKWALLGGCIHANPNGLRLYRFDSESEANEWWRLEVIGLTLEKQQRRQQLEETFKRINEAKTRSPLSQFPDASPPMDSRGSEIERDERELVREHDATDGATDGHSDADSAAKLSGGRTGKETYERAVNAICEVGNSIWPSHKWNHLSGKCERCGASL